MKAMPKTLYDAVVLPSEKNSVPKIEEVSL
jgi:hypothetical protein